MTGRDPALMQVNAERQLDSPLRRWRRRGGVLYLYEIPALAFFVIFIGYPILWVIYTSLFSSTLHGTTYWTGIGNYSVLFRDPTFWITVRNMGLWGLLTIPVQMVIGGLLAYAIEQYAGRLKAVFRTIYFIPVVTSVVVIAIVWEQIYAPYYGILQAGLAEIGIRLNFSLLGSYDTAIFALIIVNIWEWTGFSMLMYIAGLNNIPREIFDASHMDGASGWRLARYVLIPLLSGVNKSLLLLGVIGTLQTFPLVFLMTNGGPDNASQVFGTYVFLHGFTMGQTGFASAISVVVLIVAAGLTVLQIRYLGTQFLARKGEV